MSNSKFIAEWNEIFHYKIREDDLEKPSESFVFSALIDYLKMFGMDIAPLINSRNSENPEVRRNFNFKFCAYIDHLYKISDQSNSFVYYDLIKPSPKRITHMLKILLNYMLYFNMLRNDTVAMAQEKMDELSELKNRKTNHDIEIEKDKNTVELIKNKIEQHNAVIAKLAEQIETLTFEEKVQSEKIEKLRDTMKHYDSTLSELKYTEEKLNSEIVSDQEIESLLHNKASLEKAFIEQEENERITLFNNQNRKEIINKIQPCIKKIEAVMSICSVEEKAVAKEMRMKLEEVAQKYQIQKSTNEMKANAIKMLFEQEENLERAINDKSKILQNLIEKSENEITELSMKTESEDRSIDNLRSQLQALQNEIEEQHSNGEYIVVSFKQTLEAVNELL